MEQRRDVFQAIADPTRRAILGLLAAQTLTLNALAVNFNISRPAISKQVRVLEECGLIEITQYGRERFCEARLDRLQEVSHWIEQYREFWESRFEALDEYLHTIQSKKKNKKH